MEDLTFAIFVIIPAAMIAVPLLIAHAEARGGSVPGMQMRLEWPG